jgi:glycosyltransferase involved in cell wall biosynthesis
MFAEGEAVAKNNCPRANDESRFSVKPDADFRQIGSRKRSNVEATDDHGAASSAVVIPCRNCEKWIGRAIQSALDQKAAVVIVVDDGSTDGSFNVIQSFGDRVLWETGPNKGAPAARNRGLSLVSADYVMFLDSDDYVEGDLLSGLGGAAQDARADIAFGPFAFDFEGKARRDGWRLDRSVDSTEALACAWLDGHYVPTCSVLWRTEFVARIGGWREGLLRNQDGELVLRALLAGARWAFSERGLGVYFHHDAENRVTKNKSLQPFVSHLGILNGLSAECRSDRLRAAFARAYYNLARSAYREGHEALGDRAREMAVACGLPGHHGAVMHRVAASLIGLQQKERLSLLFNRRFRSA